MLKIFIFIFILFLPFLKTATAQGYVIFEKPATNFENCDSIYRGSILEIAYITTDSGIIYNFIPVKDCIKIDENGNATHKRVYAGLYKEYAGLYKEFMNTQIFYCLYDDFGYLQSVACIDTKTGKLLLSQQMLPIFDTITLDKMKNKPLYSSDTAIIVQRCNSLQYMYNIHGVLLNTTIITWGKDNICTEQVIFNHDMSMSICTYSSEIINEYNKLYKSIGYVWYYNSKGKLVRKAKIK